jgi:hypothetical protein
MTSWDITLLEVLTSERQFEKLQKRHDRLMKSLNQTPVNLWEESGRQTLPVKYKYQATCPGCKSFKIQWEIDAPPSKVCWVPFCSNCVRVGKRTAKHIWFMGLKRP